MLEIEAGDLLELCLDCPGCGIRHLCGSEACQHDFAFAVENERADETVLARFFLIGDQRVPTRAIVAAKWHVWIPEEIEDLYEEWMGQHGWDEFGGDF